MRTRRRIGYMVLALLLMVAAAGVCGPTKESAAPVAEKPTLKWVGMNSWYSGNDLTNSDVIKQLQERGNVKLDLELLDPNTYGDVMKLRLAAGKSDIGEVVQLPSMDEDMSYIKSGLFIEIGDYINKLGANIREVYAKEYPEMKAALTTPDGKQYYISQIYMTNTLVENLMINRRWLSKLSLAMPKTTDEFYKTLVAFKTRDPNGNGKPDEVPLVAWVPNMGVFWGLNLNTGFHGDASGAECSYTSERYLSFLKYFNKLYTEGLLDKDWTSRGFDQRITLAAQDAMGSVWDFSWHSSATYSTKYADYDGKVPVFSNIEPLQGPYGDKHYWAREGLGMVYGITKYAKQPEAAFKFLDFCYSREGRDLLGWGIENVSYVVVDGKKQLTDLGRNQEYLKKSGIGCPGMPLIQEVSVSYSYVPQWHIDEDKALGKFFKPVLNPIYAFADETDTIKKYSADIRTFWTENLVAFVTGTRSLDQFGQYLEQCKSFRVDELQQVYSKQFKRFFGAMKK